MSRPIPFEGGKQAVAECWRNLTAVGATPLAVTDNLNFGNPEKPEIMGQLVRAIEGIGEACRALDFPIVSGNVSLYNETNGEAILPTPAIGGVGLIDDWRKSATLAFKAEGEAILLAGAPPGWGTHLGQSLYLREILGREDGPPPPVDLAHEKRVGDFVRGLIRDGLVTAVHDLSDGGLAVALAEMAMASGIGATVDEPDGRSGRRLLRRGPGALPGDGGPIEHRGSVRRARGSGRISLPGSARPAGRAALGDCAGRSPFPSLRGPRRLVSAFHGRKTSGCVWLCSSCFPLSRIDRSPRRRPN